MVTPEKAISMVLFTFFGKIPLGDREAAKENFLDAIRDNRENLSPENEIMITRAFLDAATDGR